MAAVRGPARDRRVQEFTKVPIVMRLVLSGGKHEVAHPS
jgi:hypothetical protein